MSKSSRGKKQTLRARVNHVIRSVAGDAPRDREKYLNKVVKHADKKVRRDRERIKGWL